MAGERVGRRVKVSPARAVVMEFLHHAQKVPSLPLSKSMCLADLLGPRKELQISWTSLFIKAYSLVAQEIPELRRTYIPYPWGHFYEHPESVAALLVERDMGSENAVLAGRLRGTERLSIEAIDASVRKFREAPLEEISYFRQLLRLGRYPAIIRRWVFWQSLYWSGYWRTKRFGTFMVSSLGSLGVDQIHPRTFLTTYLTFGPISDDGNVEVKIVYDHRVLDGRTVARALVALEKTLNGPILRELQGYSQPRIEAWVA